MGDLFENLVFSEEDLITFPDGIPGFEDHKKFVITPIKEYLPFEWLVSANESGLRFAIINPMIFDPDYAPNIEKNHLKNLGINKPEEILIYVIVTINENPAESTANCLGPIIINKTTKQGRQIIIDDDKYSTKDKILRN